MNAQEVINAHAAIANPQQRDILMRFFKTSKGEYGEGDKFLGLKVPQTRNIVKRFKGLMDFNDIRQLLYSEWHEVRLAGFLFLVEEMKNSLPKRKEPLTAKAEQRKEIVDFYLRHAHKANNWDLVDLSCPYLLGSYLLYPDKNGVLPSRDILDKLAADKNMWLQRISVVSTLALIRAGEYKDTLRISTELLSHPHDLIHKAVGWMLREVGKRNKSLLVRYLHDHYSKMHRTTLRYAIERFEEEERKTWLRKPVNAK